MNPYTEPVITWKHSLVMNEYTGCGEDGMELSVWEKEGEGFHWSNNQWREESGYLPEDQGTSSSPEEAQDAAETAYKKWHRRRWLRGLEWEFVSSAKVVELFPSQWSIGAVLMIGRRCAGIIQNASTRILIIDGGRICIEQVNEFGEHSTFGLTYKTLGESLDAANALAEMFGGWAE